MTTRANASRLNVVLPKPWIALLIAGVLLLLASMPAPMTRTQEARVLETSREMLGQDWRGWMVPHTNGAVRLKKPPLAYWLSAASFAAFGVSTDAGRLPAVLAAWGTIAFTFLIARRLFNERAAWCAAAVLLGTYLFMKFMLLAETDTLATIFVTAGIYAALRCFDDTRRMRWQHLMALCMALGILAKGPPAGFVALFLIGLCAIRRDWRPVREFVTSGAMLTLVIIAAPWFLYVLRYAPGGQLGADLRNSAAGGEGHAGSALEYVPSLSLALLPWTLLALAIVASAIYLAIQHRRETHPAGRSVFITLLWIGVILIPLAVWGNKQLHYLLPLMPAIAVLTGWGLDRVISPDAQRHERMMRGIVDGMFYVLLLTPIAVYIMAHRMRLATTSEDYALIGVLAVLSIAAIRFGIRGSWPQRVAWTSALSVGAMYTAAIWGATLPANTPDAIAARLNAQFPLADYVFRGPEHLPTCFAFRRVIPSLTDDELAARAASPMVICLERGNKKDLLTMPKGYREAVRYIDGANFTAVYVPIER